MSFNRIKDRIKEGLLPDMWRESKWIYRYAQKFRLAIFIYILLGIMGTITGLTASAALKRLIDGVILRNAKDVWLMIVLIIPAVLAGIAIKAITERISSKVYAIVNNEMHQDVYTKILGADWETISEYRTGDLLNCLKNDVSAVSGGVLGGIPSLITEFLRFVGVLAVIMYYDPTMALILLLSAPVTLALSESLTKRIKNHNPEARRMNSTITAFDQESLQNIQTIKSLGLSYLFCHNLSGLQKRYYDKTMDYNMFSIITASLLSLTGLIPSCVTLGWSLYRLWGGFITYGTVILFLLLSKGLYESFTELVSRIPASVNATSSAGRIMSVMNLSQEPVKEDYMLKILMQNGMYNGLTVRLSDVSFRYRNGRCVLENINLMAAPGEIVAVTGGSEEEKSALIRILLGLVLPKTGQAILEDFNGIKVPVSAATRKLFSYVPHENAAFTGTIADNMRLVKPDATDEEILEALKIACGNECIEHLPKGIYAWIGENGEVFSQEQAQRLSIARGALKKAPFFILDEATSALDAATERNILRNIMAYDKTRTVIVITERPSVLTLCDRVYCINGTGMTEFSMETALATMVSHVAE